MTVCELEILLAAALQYLGAPYIWQGSGPNGFDCSGYVREVLHASKALPIPDTTAQGMFNHLMANKGQPGKYAAGALAFYGQSLSQINHVMLLLGPTIVIGATGGDHTTLTVEDANRRSAFVKLRAVDYRKDLVAVVMPDYPSGLRLSLAQ